MPSQKSQAPLRLKLKHSKRLTQLIIFMHGLALVACIMNSLPLLLKCVLLLAISGHFYINRKIPKLYQLEYNETAWKIAEHEDFTAIEILPSTVISIFAIFLHFKTDNKPNNTLVIFNDALAKDDYRHLIVKLKTTVSK